MVLNVCYLQRIRQVWHGSLINAHGTERGALEQIDRNLEEIRHQTQALSLTIGEAELL